MRIAHRFTLTLMLASMLALPVAAQDFATDHTEAETAPAPLTEAQFAELDTFILKVMDSINVPGAAVAVVQGGEVVYTGTFGVADITTGAPVTTDTSFMIGSVTKPMTTMMVATMVDDGLLTWDTPVSTFAPEFALSDPAVTAQLTVRDFFNMASGFPSYDTPMMIDRMSPLSSIAFMRGVELVTPFRQGFNYANQMVAAGGYYTARLATGSDADSWDAYTEQMQERVFAPIGMTATVADFDAAMNLPDRATPHYVSRIDGEPVVLPVDRERFVSPVYPAGSVWSNINDMAKFLVTQMNDGVAPDGTRVVSAEALGETRVPVIPAFGGIVQYGMGMMVSDYHGQPHLEHGGNTIGFSATHAFLPQSDIGVVILTNREVANLFTTVVRQYVYEMALGLEHTPEAEFEQFQGMEQQYFGQYKHLIGLPIAPTDAVAAHLGEYEHGVVVSVENGVPTITIASGSYPLTVTPDGTYVMEAAPLTFLVTLGAESITFSLPGNIQQITMGRL
jgi:CubicO group peptidase (beta-lactamase class C family)